MKKTMFFLGKGGVGKSTVSSATAVRLSREDPILHVSLDPAHNLADIYGMELTRTIRPVASNLDALEVDLQEWVTRYLRQSQQELRENYAHTSTINLDPFFSVMKYTPGTEEYAVLWAIEDIVAENSSRYQTIIFDTPPTALSLRFLVMPTVSKRWVEELTRLRELILTKRQTVLRINPEATTLQGAATKDDDRVYNRLIGISSRLSRLYELFTRESYITVIVNDDKLSVAESRRIRDELTRIDIPLHSVCLNKISCTDPEDQESAIAEVFPGLPLFTTGIVMEGINAVNDLEHLEVGPLVAHFRSS